MITLANKTVAGHVYISLEAKNRKEEHGNFKLKRKQHWRFITR